MPDERTLTSRGARATARGGFTLFELIVVVVILAMLFSLAVPRLIGQERRALEVAADQTLDLLTMFAQRETMSHRPVALSYDADENWLMLMVLEQANPSAGNDTFWRVDSIVQPVKLPDNVVVWEVRADGDPIDISAWPLTHTPGQQRPSIEIVLQAEGRTATIALDPFAVAARRLDGALDLATLRAPLDLDNAGLGREDW